MKITVNHPPIAASRPRVTRWATFYNEPYSSYRDYLKTYMTKAASEQKIEMHKKHVPLCVDIDFYMPIPKGTSKKKTLAMENQWQTKKPDKDNLAKSVYDAMNGVMFHDDGQVCDGRERKMYSSEPRTEITIKEIT